jgi:hypothetical protein
MPFMAPQEHESESLRVTARDRRKTQFLIHRCLRAVVHADRKRKLKTVDRVIHFIGHNCRGAQKKLLRQCARSVLRQCRVGATSCETTTTTMSSSTRTSTFPAGFCKDPGVCTTTTSSTISTTTSDTTTTTESASTTTTTRPPLESFLGTYNFVGNRTSGPCGVYPPADVVTDAATGQLYIYKHDVTTMNGSVILSGPTVGGFVSALISRSPEWPTWVAATNTGTCGIFIPTNPKPGELKECGLITTSMTGLPAVDESVPGASWVEWQRAECTDRWDGTWSVQTAVSTTTSMPMPTTSTTAPDFSCLETTTTTVAAVTTTTQAPDCAGPIAAYVQTYGFAGQLVLDECGPIPPNPWFVVPPPSLSGRLHIDTIGTDRRKLLGDLDVGTSPNCFSPYSFEIGGRVAGEMGYPEWAVASDLTPFEQWAWVPSGTMHGQEGDHLEGWNGGRSGTLSTSMIGLPRERVGCQEVPGVVEVRLTDPDCTMRWEGTWTWLDN